MSNETGAWTELRLDAAGGSFIRLSELDPATTLDDQLQSSGTRFLLAITVPSTDNCNMYLGDFDLTSLSSLPLGATAPQRLYLGSNLVCGDSP